MIHNLLVTKNNPNKQFPQNRLCCGECTKNRSCVVRYCASFACKILFNVMSNAKRVIYPFGFDVVGASCEIGVASIFYFVTKTNEIKFT